jgi:uncharacterized OB-fold protein
MARPQPRFPEPDTQPFWEETKAHRLTYQVCGDCGFVVWYPRRTCTQCGSLNLERKASAGNGTVYSYSVVRSNRMPGFAELGAYAVAIIELDEGFRMISNVVGVEDRVTGVHIGQRVRLKWEDPEEGYPLPLFEPAG